jgi:hypothetical protein
MTPITTPTTNSGPVVIGEAELRAMVAAIRAEISGAEVRLFGWRSRIDSCCWGACGAAWPTTASLLICSCTPAVRWKNAAVGATMGSQEPVGRDGCSMSNPEAVGMLRIARRDLKAARMLQVASISIPSRWGSIAPIGCVAPSSWSTMWQRSSAPRSDGGA